MSGVYIYTDRDDRVQVERSRIAGEVTVRIGTVAFQMYIDTAAELHTALGEALATTPDEAGSS
jgi:hypothetical protein